jgi:lambda family phage tail tape measure protein
MATIENFLLKFKVEGANQLTSAANAVKGLSDQVSGLGGNIGPLGDGISGLFGKLGPLGIAAGAAATAFLALGSRAITLAGEISDIAGATGISEGALLSLKDSIIDAGGSATDFGSVATKLNQSIQEAAGGNEKLQNSFRSLGVFVTDANGNIRNTETILRDVTDRFRTGAISGEQYSAAVDILGKNISRLDLTKLQAVADPIQTENIKKLDEYGAAIDRVRAILERQILSFFGQAAQQAEQLFNKIDQYQGKLLEEERKLNERGRTSRALSIDQPMTAEPGSGIPFRFGGRQMTPAEQQALREQRRLADMERLMRPYGPRTGEAPETGGFGAQSPDQVRRLEESRRQTILRGEQEAQRQREENAAVLAKFELEQGQAELRRYEQTQRLVRQGQVDAEAEVEATRRAQAEYEKQQATANETARRRSEAYKESVNVLEDQIMLENSLRGLNSIQANTYRKINEEIIRRKQALEELKNIENLSYQERLAREAQILDQSARAIEIIKEQGAEEYNRSISFSDGWDQAFKKYAQAAGDAASQAGRYFDTFSRGFEDAIVRFVQTGKLSFKDLANSIIADFVRIQAQKMFTSLFGGGGLLSGIGSLFGFANGGAVQSMRPIIVGERGPELFVPRMAGNIISNQNLRQTEAQPQITNVNYNINAVDAPSFRSLVARDPQFIYNVTEVGRRASPSRRLA